MANIYVRSTDGNNADNGSTWALAKATLAGAAAIDGAGDSIYVSQSHAESTASGITVTLAGTLASPTRVICGDDGAAPPATIATTGTVTSTGGGNVAIDGSVYCYGLTFNVGTGATQANFVAHASAGAQFFEQCTIALLNTHANSFIGPGSTTGAAGTTTRWKNCSVKFSATSQFIYGSTPFHWNGGGVVSGGSTPVTLFSTYDTTTVAHGGVITVENVDFSNFASTVNLSIPPPRPFKVTFRHCKLPASWSGSLITGSFTSPGRIEMFNCDSGSTNYKLWIEDYLGQIKDETTIVRTGGASDGVTPIAWKMVSSANAVYPLNALASPEFVVYNSTTGSSKTITVEILRDSATNLTDAEVWLEVNYLSASGSPIGSLITDAKADVLAAAADQTTSSTTWTTTGMANPNKQKLAVTFTPQKKGPFYCRVMLAKASTTIYVDPLATVS